MVVVIKNGIDKDQQEHLVDWLKSMNIDVHETVGEFETILGLIGDTSHVDIDLINSLDIVEKVTRISEPFKNANRKFHPDDTVIDIGGYKIGGGNFQYIAGPCSVESPEQICSIAKETKEAGAMLLRGGVSSREPHPMPSKV